MSERIPAVAVKDLSRRFGDFVAVDRIDLRSPGVRSSDFSGRTARASPPPSACSAACLRPRAEAGP